MAIAQYIEVNITLDSFDLIQIETLINLRIDELKKFKAEADGWMHKQLADEQLYNYRATLKKIKAARTEVKRIKAESDAKFAADRKAAANGRSKR